MKTATIHVTFEEEKIAALNLYLGQKNMTVEAELQDALTSLYQRHVPSQVRDFISLRNDGSPDPVIPKQKRPKPASASMEDLPSSEQ